MPFFIDIRKITILNAFAGGKSIFNRFYVLKFRNIKFLLQKFKLDLEYNAFINILIYCNVYTLVYLFISIVSYISMKQYINILAPVYHRIMQEGQ